MPPATPAATLTTLLQPYPIPDSALDRGYPIWMKSIGQVDSLRIYRRIRRITPNSVNQGYYFSSIYGRTRRGETLPESTKRHSCRTSWCPRLVPACRTRMNRSINIAVASRTSFAPSTPSWRCSTRLGSSKLRRANHPETWGRHRLCPAPQRP